MVVTIVSIKLGTFPFSNTTCYVILAQLTFREAKKNIDFQLCKYWTQNRPPCIFSFPASVCLFSTISVQVDWIFRAKLMSEEAKKGAKWTEIFSQTFLLRVPEKFSDKSFEFRHYFPEWQRFIHVAFEIKEHENEEKHQ